MMKIQFLGTAAAEGQPGLPRLDDVGGGEALLHASMLVGGVDAVQPDEVSRGGGDGGLQQVGGHPAAVQVAAVTVVHSLKV